MMTRDIVPGVNDGGWNLYRGGNGLAKLLSQVFGEGYLGGVLDLVRDG